MLKSGIKTFGCGKVKQTKRVFGVFTVSVFIEVLTNTLFRRLLTLFFTEIYRLSVENSAFIA